MIIATALRTSRWELVPARTSGTSASFAVGNLGMATVRGQIPVTTAWADVDATGPAHSRARRTRPHPH